MTRSIGTLMASFMTRTRSSARVIVAVTGVALALGGCASKAGADSEEAAAIAAVTAVMTADAQRICVDNATNGDALAVYRTMMVAPDPSRRPLSWHQPVPLRPVTTLSERQMIDDEFRADRVRLVPPGNISPVLPTTAQLQLDSVARAMAAIDRSGTREVRIPAAPLVAARWWPLNRLWPQCLNVFTISNPVVVRDMGFVTVRGGHWGTVYALRKQGARWSVNGQWTNWLY